MLVGGRRVERPEPSLVAVGAPAEPPARLGESPAHEPRADAGDLVAGHRGHRGGTEDLRITIAAAIEEHLAEGRHVQRRREDPVGTAGSLLDLATIERSGM